MTSEEALLLHVTPPILFTVAFLTTPINSLVVPSHSLGVYQCYKHGMWNMSKQYCYWWEQSISLSKALELASIPRRPAKHLNFSSQSNPTDFSFLLENDLLSRH